MLVKLDRRVAAAYLVTSWKVAPRPRGLTAALLSPGRAPARLRALTLSALVLSCGAPPPPKPAERPVAQSAPPAPVPSLANGAASVAVPPATSPPDCDEPAQSSACYVPAGDGFFCYAVTVKIQPKVVDGFEECYRTEEECATALRMLGEATHDVVRGCAFRFGVAHCFAASPSLNEPYSCYPDPATCQALQGDLAEDERFRVLPCVAVR